MIKIGIASDDGKNISAHFGRTMGFVIFSIDNNKIISKEYKPNTFTGHARGIEGHSNMSSTHSSIIEALKDCKAVISNGMGRRIYEDLRAAGIEAIITTETDVDKAIELYLAGSLKDNPDSGCSH